MHSKLKFRSALFQRFNSLIVLKKFIFSVMAAATLFLPSLFLLSTQVRAVNQFSTTYAVTYEVQDSGNTHVTQTVNLQNLTATYYATKYTLSVGDTKISNVVATDSNGAIIPNSLTTTANTTDISLTFNQQVVGLNQVMTFTLSYDSSDIAIKNGFVWDVTIPKLASADSIDVYNLTLKTPADVGTVASISPTPISTGTDGNFNTFSFNKSQLIQNGINASFGDHQVFNFTLKYHLKNDSFLPVERTIALPPDTEIQTVVYQKLNPAPVQMTVDTDGNYLAQYNLQGNQTTDITLSGQVKIWNKPTNPTTPLSSADLAKYTQAQQYWETQDPAILNEAKKLKTAQAIYNYVTTTLHYNYQRAASGNLQRLGAAAILNQPTNAVCMEFTDLFIALARDAGIPAREIDGFAYTTDSKLRPINNTPTNNQNSDVLHAWPEYWNTQSKTWVQIDPTWGNTTGGVDYFNKLDTNHFAFVIHGVSSTEPLPAGSYKSDPKTQTNDISVALAPTEVALTTNPQINIASPSIVTSGLPIGGILVVSNTGNSTIFNAKVSFKASDLSFQNVVIGAVPPLSTRTFDISGSSKNFNIKATDKVQVTLSGMDANNQKVVLKTVNNIVIEPLYALAVPLIMVLLILSLLVYLPYRFRYPLNDFLTRQRKRFLKG